MAPVDVKVVQAQLAVSLDQKRRLISSWLPTLTPEELASQRTEDDLMKEEAKLFLPSPPTLGVGYVLSDEASSNLRSSDGLLRRRILGKRTHIQAPNVQPKELYARKKARLSESESDENVSDDGGRGSLGKKSQKAKKHKRMKSPDEADEINDIESEEDKNVDLKEKSGQLITSSSPSQSFNIGKEDGVAGESNTGSLTSSQRTSEEETSGFLKSSLTTENNLSQVEKKRKRKKKKTKQADIPGSESTVFPASSSQTCALELMDGSVVIPQVSEIPSAEKAKKKRSRKRKNKNKNNPSTTSQPAGEPSQYTEESGGEEN